MGEQPRASVEVAEGQKMLLRSSWAIEGDVASMGATVVPAGFSVAVEGHGRFGGAGELPMVSEEMAEVSRGADDATEVVDGME